MLLVIIHFDRNYSTFPVGTRTDTLSERFSWSSRTMENTFQSSNAFTRYGPNYLTTSEPSSHIALMDE